MRQVNAVDCFTFLRPTVIHASSPLKNCEMHSHKEGKQLANKSLYIGNLPYSATEDGLRELFEPYGPIGEIRVIQNKGFGFVDIPEENVAEAIEATNGKELGGRTLTVNEARPREERGGGGRGGGGRGGYGGGGGRSRDW